MRSRALLHCIAQSLVPCPLRPVYRSGRLLVRCLSYTPLSTTHPHIDGPHASVRLSPPYPPPTSSSSSSTVVEATAPAITVDEFSALLTRAGVPPTERLAVGLSGGADSSALALLAHHESQQSHGRRPAPLILQVDHLLRPESTAETGHCNLWLAQLQPTPPIHVVLPLQWADGRPATNRLQEAARERRREALVRECGRRRVQWLLLAHHAGDQLETIVHRWTRGSGLYGLTGMATSRTVSSGQSAYRATEEAAAEDEQAESIASTNVRGDSDSVPVVLCRPLLGVSKARLIATCRQHGVRWVEDGSNNNRAYDRIRIRQALDAMLDHHGTQSQPQMLSASSSPTVQPFTADVLAAVPAILSSCQQSAHDVTTSLLHRHATLVSPFTIAFLSASAASLPFAILLVLFSRVLAVVRGGTYLTMGEPFHQLVRSMLQEHSSRSTSAVTPSDGVSGFRLQCFGCVVSTLRGGGRHKQGGWMVTRALEQVAEVAVHKVSSTVQRLPWDDRFLVHLQCPTASFRTPAGCNTVDYVLRPLRKADLSLFELPTGSSTGELRRTLLTGLPLLVRRWTVGAREGGASGEDVVLVPHLPLLPFREAPCSEAERERQAGDDNIQVSVTRLKDRVSKWDWTQHDEPLNDS